MTGAGVSEHDVYRPVSHNGVAPHQEVDGWFERNWISLTLMSSSDHLVEVALTWR